jgi:branched-chain amino acid transport system ATP-binding protein
MSFLSLENVTISFGGIRAVKNVSLDIKEGEIFALVGPNGAGKSTIFNLISRLYKQNEGNIFFDGKSLNQLKPFDMPDIGIARTFQNIELFGNATVLQNLLVGTNIRKSSNFLSEILFTRSVRKEEVTSRVMVEEVMDFLDLQQYREKYIMGLSYGTRKIVELGRALALKPKVLLLDEPASGLSAEETEDLAFWIEDIKKIMGITVLMVEHNLNLVNKVADRVAALVDGEIISVGNPKSVQSDPKVIEAYIGV